MAPVPCEFDDEDRRAHDEYTAGLAGSLEEYTVESPQQCWMTGGTAHAAERRR
jgi:hypothetical protein